MTSPTVTSPNRAALIAGPLVLVTLVVWMAGWTGQAWTAALDAFWVLVTFGVWPMLWIAGAVGYGWPLRQVLAPRSPQALALQSGLGVAAMFVLVQTLGMLGWLQSGGRLVAVVIIAAGMTLLLVQLISSRRRTTGRAVLRLPHWLIWTASPAIAVLLVASCSAPGWLWATEFGGYDALSYHLQLPREWLALGRIEPLQHNVYSYLPGYVEAAYYHLAILYGGGLEAVYACQILHASFTFLAAAFVARIAWQIGGSLSIASTAAIFLGTPWIIVVGSLAYNENVTLLMLAAGLIANLDESLAPWRRGLIIGVLAGAACGAKLTSVGLVAAPLGAALLMQVPLRSWPSSIVTACGAGMMMLMPYLLRNFAFAGNPVFPFASGILGTAHWSAEQAQVWWRGHQSDLPLDGRLIEAWNQFLRYGIGQAPAPSEPWKPQWAILPWLGITGIIFGLFSSSTRRWCGLLLLVLLVQFVFWLEFTHLKSRFLLPAAVPLALAAGTAVAVQLQRWQARGQSWSRQVMIGSVLLAWCLLPILIFRTERDKAPAAYVALAGRLTGDELAAEARELAGSTVSPAIAVNHLLPEGSLVLLIGHATPLYYRLDRVRYTTTWDRGPMSQAMRRFPHDHRAWAEELKRAGFTHILIDETMLQLWAHAGWNDPLITVERIRGLTQQHTELVWEYPGGISIHRLRP